MKKLSLIAVFGLMLAFAPSALAGKNKPPDYLCLEWETGSQYHHLSFKQVGRIYDKDHRMKTYVVTGRDQYGLIAGSSYIARGTKTILATYTGTHSGGIVSHYQMEFDMRTDTGIIYYQNIPPGGPSTSGSETVYRIKCKSLNIPVD